MSRLTSHKISSFTLMFVTFVTNSKDNNITNTSSCHVIPHIYLNHLFSSNMLLHTTEQQSSSRFLHIQLPTHILVYVSLINLTASQIHSIWRWQLQYLSKCWNTSSLPQLVIQKSNFSLIYNSLQTHINYLSEITNHVTRKESSVSHFSIIYLNQ